MRGYRLYKIDAGGLIVGPPEVIQADSDAEALRAARKLKIRRYELWHRNRLVMTSSPPAEPRSNVQPSAQPGL